jgi:hypothetical protein
MAEATAASRVHAGGLAEGLLGGLDAARRAMWRLGVRTSLGRRCLQDRAVRLQVLGLGHVAASLALTLVAPVWLLLLGPLLLGVPHVAADVRFLVLQAPLSRATRLAFMAPLAGMVLHRFVNFAGGPFSAALELGLGLGAAALLLLLAPLPWPRRVAGAGLALGVLALLSAEAGLALLAFAHLHNAVAAAAWFVLSARSGGGRWRVGSVALAWLGAAALFLGGVFDGALAAGHADVGGLSLGGLAAAMAPGVDGPLALRLVGLFAFAQSFHYAVWLRLVPQALDPRPNPPTFARTAARLRADLGRAGVLALVGLSLGLPLLAALWQPEQARHVYLLGAVFHGWLELGVFLAMACGLRGFGPGAAAEAAR